MNIHFFATFQDNHELFAMMEKTRMYIFRSLDPEVFCGKFAVFLLIFENASNESFVSFVEGLKLEIKIAVERKNHLMFRSRMFIIKTITAVFVSCFLYNLG